MKVVKCPQKKCCFDYGNCEDCNVGKYVIKTEKHIKRLKNRLNSKKITDKKDRGVANMDIGTEVEILIWIDEVIKKLCCFQNDADYYCDVFREQNQIKKGENIVAFSESIQKAILALKELRRDMNKEHSDNV